MAEERLSISTPAGEGAETAVLLHGGPGLSDYRDTLAPLLGERFRTVRYQQRGIEPTTVGPPYTVETHVAHAAADERRHGRADLARPGRADRPLRALPVARAAGAIGAAIDRLRTPLDM